MKLKELQIHQIDISTTKVVEINKKQFDSDFDSYLKGLLEIISKGSSGRLFEFQSETTEIRALIPSIIKSAPFNKVSLIAANRLLIKEQETQKKIEKLDVEIQKGILVQAVYQEDSNFKYVICKADHSEFLKDGDYKKTKGLPLKKKVFKAFIVTFSNKNLIEEVLVYDTNASMSKYWWGDFLELSEVYTDKHNTITAFDAIDKGVFTKMKKDFPQDYIYLRNSTVRYFRANKDFDMNSYISDAIGDYHPFNPSFKVQDLKDTIRELPRKKKFDEKFNIIREEIKAKFLNKISLTSQIDLHLKEDIENINSVITAEKGKDGTKYIKIKSDAGYNYFSDLTKNK